MEKIIAKIPIDRLEINNKAFRKIKNLGVEEIKNALRQNSFILVLADIGNPLRIIESEAIFDFWKINKENIAKDFNKITLEDYPNEFALVCSKWISATGSKLILLEKYH